MNNFDPKRNKGGYYYRYYYRYGYGYGADAGNGSAEKAPRSAQRRS